MEKDHKKSLSENPSLKKINADALWNRHGIEDIYFQREAQVNFWTVLGGIAVGALLTQTNNLFQAVFNGRWVLLLFFFTSINIIALSWIQNLWGSLVLRMKVTMLYTIINLMNLISLSLLCLQVTKPVAFFLVGGFYILFSVLMNIYLILTGSIVGKTPDSQKGIKISTIIYTVYMLLCFCAAANLNWAPSIAAEIGWGAFTLLVSFATMLLQHRTMKEERKAFGIP
jgi:hypothetical protein